jgi:hypothetical protein
LENLIVTKTARTMATATRRPNATANNMSFTYIDRSKGASLERGTLPSVRFDGRFLTPKKRSPRATIRQCKAFVRQPTSRELASALVMYVSLGLQEIAKLLFEIGIL